MDNHDKTIQNVTKHVVPFLLYCKDIAKTLWQWYVRLAQHDLQNMHPHFQTKPPDATIQHSNSVEPCWTIWNPHHFSDSQWTWNRSLWQKCPCNRPATHSLCLCDPASSASMSLFFHVFPQRVSLSLVLHCVAPCRTIIIDQPNFPQTSWDSRRSAERSLGSWDSSPSNCITVSAQSCRQVVEDHVYFMSWKVWRSWRHVKAKLPNYT